MIRGPWSVCEYVRTAIFVCEVLFIPYANHSPGWRINLQMCHYPSGSAAITLQLHNSRLASWAPHMHAEKYTHTALTAVNKDPLIQRWESSNKISHTLLHNQEANIAQHRSNIHHVYGVMTALHGSSPSRQQDGNWGQLSTFTHSCFLATLSRSVASLRFWTAAHNAIPPLTEQLNKCTHACVCIWSTYLWRGRSRSEVKVEQPGSDMQERR